MYMIRHYKKLVSNSLRIRANKFYCDDISVIATNIDTLYIRQLNDTNWSYEIPRV